MIVFWFHLASNIASLILYLLKYSHGNGNSICLCLCFLILGDTVLTSHFLDLGSWKAPCNLRLVYFAWKGDLKARKQCHGFQRYYRCKHLCDKCCAVQPMTNAPETFTYKNMSPNAPYATTVKDHDDYIRSTTQISDWSVVQGWQYESVSFDMMHIVFLGIAKNHIPSCLKILRLRGFLLWTWRNWPAIPEASKHGDEAGLQRTWAHWNVLAVFFWFFFRYLRKEHHLRIKGSRFSVMSPYLGPGCTCPDAVSHWQIVGLSGRRTIVNWVLGSRHPISRSCAGGFQWNCNGLWVIQTLNSNNKKVISYLFILEVTDV